MVAALTLLLAACAPPTTEPPAGTLTVVQEQQASWVRNFNPYALPGMNRWPTAAGIHEPMAIYDMATSAWVPWLATAWQWADPLTLDVTLRDGVQWSDGEPLTVDDVVFSFELLQRFPALDTQGVWRFLDAVTTPTPQTLRFTLSQPQAPGLGDILQLPIVPAHTWAAVTDPVAYANPEPVASGPFTEVRRFESQVWELGRNPHYWGATPGVEVLRFPALGSNDQVTLALIEGVVDWAGSFVPAVQRTYVDRDPEHFHYWFPPLGGMVFLYPNTTRPPLDDARVRKAISLALDRGRMVEIAMYGYTAPASPTGMSEAFATWRPGTVSSDWIAYDVARANVLLDEAGLKRGPDGLRRGPDGAPLQLEITAVSGWSDWVRAAQLSARMLTEAGIDARLRTYDFGAWFEKVQRGDFDMTIGWSVEADTPYRYFKDLLSSVTVKPVGTAATSNWHRFGSARADDLLATFERTTDPLAQHALVVELQAVFAQEAPAIPLFANPSWGEASTRRFVGWPSADDPYARLSPNHVPESLLVLARLRAR